MASSWGESWLLSWGNSWGRIVTLSRRPGGWLPLKYVRKDGKIVDTLAEPEQLPIPPELDIPVDIVIPPSVLAAFFTEDHTPALMAEVARSRAELQRIQRRMREEEEIALALLLT